MGDTGRRPNLAGTSPPDELSAEIERLHRHVRRQWSAVASPSWRGAESAFSPATWAGAVLTLAREIAARRVIDLEPLEGRRPRVEARRLLLLTPPGYEDIVMRAHRWADRSAVAARDQLRPAGPDGDGAARSRAELELTAAYLRMFVKAGRSALQVELGLTAKEFEHRLGATGRQERRSA
jgi:hypothetical protein